MTTKKKRSGVPLVTAFTAVGLTLTAIGGAITLNNELNASKHFTEALLKNGYTEATIAERILPNNSELILKCPRQTFRYFDAVNPQGQHVEGVACQSLFNANVRIIEARASTLQNTPS